MVTALTGRQSVSFVCDYLLELADEGGLFCCTQATVPATGHSELAERPFFFGVVRNRAPAPAGGIGSSVMVSFLTVSRPEHETEMFQIETKYPWCGHSHPND